MALGSQQPWGIEGSKDAPGGGGGGGGVAGVTAGDGTITIGGTVTNPTVKVAAATVASIATAHADATAAGAAAAAAASAAAAAAAAAASKVAGVSAGTGIAVDNTDPTHPIVSSTGVLGVVGGAGINVDNTDPLHPIVSTPALAVANQALAATDILTIYPGASAALLPDADSSIGVAPSGTAADATHGSLFFCSSSTSPRTITLDPTGALPGEELWIIFHASMSVSNDVVNGGGGGGTLFTCPAGGFGNAARRQAVFRMNAAGTDWEFERVVRINV
jgi:hypothetical protein